MDYLKLFQNHTEYEAFVSGGTMVKPNVSHCVSENEVHYNAKADYSNEYLTFIARENGTISFNIWYSMGTEYITSISYSTDNGETWTTTQNQNNKEEHLTITVIVNEGDKVMWKGDATQLGYYDEYDYGDIVGSFFSSTCEFDAQGNVMSLLYGDYFKGKTTIENEIVFGYLFSDYDVAAACEIVNAENLSLPATTLTSSCYVGMFSNCTSLTVAPELPATTLASNCYRFMFYNCRSLTTAPELPATTLASACYFSMFKGCTSLVNGPELSATTLEENCYYNMFLSCTSLNSITCLATDISATDCTSSWVYGVAANGTFTKAASMNSWTTGQSGIPTNWTVQNAS